MIKAVLDTNIYISAYLWKGKPHKILKLGLKEEIIIIYSKPIARELREKLLTKFSKSNEKATSYLGFIERMVYLVEPVKISNIVKQDPSDDKIIATAIAGKADYIVSGDKHLLNLKEVRGIKIVNSTEFLKKITQTYT